MSRRFEITCRWLEPADSPRADRRLLVEVGIEADGVSITALEDTREGTYRSGIRVSADVLAAWFVANWWRLRWEAFGEGASWDMSHRIGAAGHGYLWPDLEFIGGDATVEVRSKPVTFTPACPLRFLREISIPVQAQDFETATQEFIETVVARMDGRSGSTEEDVDALPAAWQALRNEIADPELGFERAVEARMGFDPEEAEPAPLRRLLEASREVGRNAVEELASSSKARACKDLDALWGDVRERSRPMRIVATPELRDGAAQVASRNEKPWRKGVKLAELARIEWSINGDAVPNDRLAEVCEVPAGWIGDGPDTDTPLAAGFRGRGEEDRLVATLKKRRPTGRRFTLARIIGDHLLTGAGERLLPVTDAITERQKFQRAFAQAFLCPVAILRDHLGSNVPDDDYVEDAAHHFQVSPLLVRWALINSGLLRSEPPF